MATGQGVGINSDSPEEVVSQLFGDDVAKLVWAVTNEPKPEGGLSDEQKRKVYADKVDSLVRGMVATGDPRAFLVKLSDLVDNASSLRAAWEIAPEGEKPRFLKRFAKYAEAMPSVALGVVQLAELAPEHVHVNLQAATHRMLRNLWVLASNTDAEEAQAALREARKVLSDC